MRAWIAQHLKFIVPLIGAGITIATLIWGAGNPWVIAVVAVATAAGVYQAPNRDPESAPAAAAPVPPSSPGSSDGGGTGTVRLVAGPAPSGSPPGAAGFVQHHYPPGPGWRRW